MSCDRQDVVVTLSEMGNICLSSASLVLDDTEQTTGPIALARPPMTRVAFVGIAARIAGNAASWAADCAQYPGPERQGEPMEREAALRFCARIQEFLTVIKEDARG